MAGPQVHRERMKSLLGDVRKTGSLYLKRNLTRSLVSTLKKVDY